MGNPNGGMSRIPADFLIDEHGVLLDVYYGKDASDNIPLSQIEKRLLTPSATKKSKPMAYLPRNNKIPSDLLAK